MIFETNSLPYAQRTIVSERDSSSASACIDDSGGGGEIPIDNNNIGDDDADNNGGSDHILKRNSASVLQRHSFENVENENDNDDDDEDETSQGIYAVFFSFLFRFFSSKFLNKIQGLLLSCQTMNYNHVHVLWLPAKFLRYIDLFWFQYE